jgi:hypothetical protein
MSNEQFIRYGKLEIKSNDKIIDLSEFAYEFNISAYLIDTPNTLDIRIFNLSTSTENEIIDEGLVITLTAGYIGEGMSGIIFDGAIVQIRTGKQGGVDTFIDITATDGDGLYKDGFIAETVQAGSNARQRYNNILAKTSYKPESWEIAISNLNDENRLPRGKVYYGRTTEFLRTESAQCGADWTYENNTVRVLGRDEYLNPDITHIINAQTGMIGLPTQTIEGIQVKCLLNPNLKPGERIELNNDSIQQRRIGTELTEQSRWTLEQSIITEGVTGHYKLIGLSHNGSNRGPNWYSELICNIPVNYLPSQNKYIRPVPQ